MHDSRLRQLFLEAEISCFHTPEERIITSFECLILTIKLQQAAEQSVNETNES